jgi:hypothetical protein
MMADLATTNTLGGIAIAAAGVTPSVKNTVGSLSKPPAAIALIAAESRAALVIVTGRRDQSLFGPRPTAARIPGKEAA